MSTGYRRVIRELRKRAEMGTLERLKEIEETLKRYPECVDNLPVIWGEVAKALPKLLAVVEAADKFIEVWESGPYRDQEYEALKASVIACRKAAQ